MFKNLSITGLILASLATMVFSVETDRQFGEASYQFLKMDLSPSLIGRASAAVASGSSVSESDVNIAAAANDSALLDLNRAIPFQEFQARASQVWLSVPLRSYHWLVSARFLGFEQLRGFDSDANPEVSYGAHTLKVETGLAGRSGKTGENAKWLWGASVSYAENSVAYTDYSTAMLNLGLIYRLPYGLSLGLSGRNIDFFRSSAYYTDNEAPFPPTTAQAGLAWKSSLPKNLSLEIELDARTRNDEKMVLPAGLSIKWQNLITGRMGYVLLAEEVGIQLGLGINWSFFRFDYAYQHHSVLSAAHFWSLGIEY